MSETPTPAEPSAVAPSSPSRGERLRLALLSPRPLAPVRFGLRTLLALMVVSAVYISLLTRTGIWAVVAAFVALVALYFVRVPTESQPLKQLGIDLLRGILLPILCIIYDPFIFHDPSVRALGVLVYGFQMLLLLVWIIAGARLAPLSCVLAGGMSWGGLIAGLTGLALLVPSVIGLVFGIGILGFTPLLTMWIFWRNATEAVASAHLELPRWALYAWMTLGFVLSMLAPLALYALLGEELTAALKPFRLDFLYKVI